MHKDFKELLEVLNDNQVEYLIVGGYALIEYTEPRFTKDLDIWIRADGENAARTLKSLSDFGAPSFGATVEDLSQPDNVLQIGVPPLRIDIITSIDGVGFNEAWGNKVKIDFDGVPVFIIGAKDLLKNKRSTSRDRDKEEAAMLESALKSQGRISTSQE